MPTLSRYATPMTLLSAFCASGAVWAQDTRSAAALSEVTVTAPDERPAATKVTEDVEALPASVTVIEKKDLDRKTLNTYGDMLRGVAGVNVLEYQQGLIAYGLTLRGFDSDHGRNIGVFLDGMPLNVTGSQHTNGYMDLAQVIPELVNRAELVRGPFSVFAGNHAVGGSLQLYTEAAAPSSLKVTVDSFGRTRILPIKTFDVGPGQLLVALDATKGNGYTRQSDIERYNLFTRYQMRMGNGIASVRLQLYDAKAEAPGYLDRDALVAGRIGLRDFLSRGIGDAKRQQNLVFNYRSDDAEGTGGWGTGWFASLYFNDDTRKRWVNFDLTTPVGSDATLRQERDRLDQVGFDLRMTTSFSTAGLPSQFTGGIQFNREQINARRFFTNADHDPLSPSALLPDPVLVDRRVLTTTTAAYGQYQIQPTERLKITAGLRYDHIAFDTRLPPGRQHLRRPHWPQARPARQGKATARPAPSWALLSRCSTRLPTAPSCSPTWRAVSRAPTPSATCSPTSAYRPACPTWRCRRCAAPSSACRAAPATARTAGARRYGTRGRRASPTSTQPASTRASSRRSARASTSRATCWWARPRGCLPTTAT